MEAREFYAALLDSLEHRKDIVIRKYKIKYRKGKYDFLRIASKKIGPNDRVILIRAGIHGEEIAGPLTILFSGNEIIDYIHRAGLRLIIYPLDNPSGFELKKRYNIDDDKDIKNNDFLRYEFRGGGIIKDLGKKVGYERWYWSSDPKLRIRLPEETELMHKLLKKDPLPQVSAVIDLHQDYISNFPAAAYHYAFGNLSCYQDIVKNIEKLLPILSNTEIGAGQDFPMKSDNQGFIVRHDGTLTDLFFRLGVKHSITVETTGTTLTGIAKKVNLIWIFGITDLVKEEIMKRFALSKSIESLEPSVTFAIDAKVKEMQKQGIKVYNFNLGEPDFQTPSNVKSAAIKAILANKTRYTQVQGMPELLEAICEKFKRDNNLIYSPKEVIVSNGAKQAIYLAIRTICEVGDEIIVLAPYWTSYPDIVRLSGGRPVIVRSEDFRLSAKAIKKAITRKTKAIIVNSPNNPTSIVYTFEELKELAELVLKHKILVISDEIYEKFLYNRAEHFSFASLDKRLKDYTLTINGVSKTYAMTGWRIGYCGGPAYIVEKMIDLQSHVSSNASSISQAASIEALLGEQIQVQKMISEFDKRRTFVCREFENLGIQFIKSEGAYYVFFKVEPNFSSMSFCKNALEDFQVALNPGETFGVPGWVRLSYTVGLDDLKEGVRRIGNIKRDKGVS